MKSMKKTIAALVAISMIFGCVIGGTLAWLVDGNKTVTNTFTAGDINITLTESKYNVANNTLTTSNQVSENNDYKMVPGTIMPKDPRVVVKAESEACWLFVKVEKLNGYDTYLSAPAIDSGWTLVPGETSVYYREVAATGDNDSEPFYVLTNETYTTGAVKVNESVTKAQLDTLDGKDTTELPQLKFTAYAIQSDNLTDVNGAVTTAERAWALVNAQ